MNISRLMRRNLQKTLKRVTGMTALLLLLQACSTDKETALVFEPDLTNHLGTPTTPNNNPPVGVDPSNPDFWILNGGVEQGVEPWFTRGARIAQSEAQAYQGRYSLLVTERSVDWHGPAMNLPLNLPAGTYRASVWVRLVAGEQPTSVKLTLQTRTAGQSTDNYSSLSQSLANNAGWVRVSGVFTHQPSAPLDTFLVYVEAERATASFYVDELTLTVDSGTEPVDPLPTEWIVNGGVENGVLPWRKVGGDSVVLQQANEYARTGSYSLFISGRTDTWHAAAMDLPKNLPTGREYRVSVWVRMAPGTSAAPVSLTLKKDFNQENPYINIATRESVTSSEWVQVVGNFVHEPYEGTLGDFYLYIESSVASASYYIDDLTMTLAGELVVNGDLAAGTTGWGPFGEVIIARTDADFVKGTHSLLVSNRSQTWQGGSFTFEPLSANHLYEFSCWVKMAPGQDASSLTLSLKTTNAENAETYPTINTKSVTNSAWVELTGSYSPAAGLTVNLGYVQSDRATASYYIDNCSAVEIEQSESISTLSEDRL